MNKKDMVDIRYTNNEDGQVLMMQGSAVSIHTAMLILLDKLAENMNATVPDVLETLEEMHKVGNELFKRPPITRMTPMERFLHEMNKPMED